MSTISNHIVGCDRLAISLLLMPQDRRVACVTWCSANLCPVIGHKATELMQISAWGDEDLIPQQQGEKNCCILIYHLERSPHGSIKFCMKMKSDWSNSSQPRGRRATGFTKTASCPGTRSFFLAPLHLNHVRSMLIIVRCPIVELKQRKCIYPSHF